MRRFPVGVVLVAVVLAGLDGMAQPGERRLGFTPASFKAQAEVERRFRGSVTASSVSDLHRPLARRPHPAGTEASREHVEHLAKTLSGFGFEVERADYEVFLSYPKKVEVEVLGPEPVRLAVREPGFDADPDSKHAELGDAFVAYSASGTATAPMVYVNYGLPDDYARLSGFGVDVKGRIAFARYGRSHRAVKVHTAEQMGAVGLILYSDPEDDGSGRGRAWPRGYWRGEEMPQRGNAKFSWRWHGDPLTPGEPALPGARRLDPASVPTLPKIPVTAISSGQARRLLETLDGPVVPAGFRGALPINYRTGPGAVQVRLAIDMDNRQAPIRNLVARLRGADQPDRMVLLGGHHDAWTFGAVDPGTGTAALLEVAKRLGQLAEQGWRPKRTIAIAFWDAEEYGLIGSTEYAEHHRRQLQEQLVAYVNTDMYMLGRFDAGGVPSLRDFLVEVATDVPVGRASVHDFWRRSEQERQPDWAGADEPAFEVELKALGSGADFVPFQDHLGVPTLSVEFTGPNGYGFGTYHSNHDTRRYVERMADPGFAQGEVLARVLGTLALRMAGADVLPFRFSHYASRIAADVDAWEAWSRDHGARTGVKPDLSPVKLLTARMRTSALALEQALDAGLADGRLPDGRTAALNDRLARLEQLLCDDEAAADSRWYRHVVYGWNIYSLYDGQPFPGLANAVLAADPSRVSLETGRIERALTRVVAALEGAAREVMKGDE
jgi:N-acetylated-alpha-linked acidic dipeptidase